MPKANRLVRSAVDLSPRAVRDAISATPQKRTSPLAQSVQYAAGIDTYADVLDKALDEVAAQNDVLRQWNKRQQSTHLRMTYSAVLDELDQQSFFKNLQDKISRTLDTLSNGEWVEASSPGLKHLARPKREWLEKLNAQELALCCNRSSLLGPFPQAMLDLSSNIRNNISLRLSEIADDAGNLSEAAVVEALGDVGRELWQVAQQGVSQRSLAELHWSTHRATPFTPVDRPISISEFEWLKTHRPEMAEKLLATAPIPRKLPALSEVVDANVDINFEEFEWVLGQHFLGSLWPLVDALLQKGARPESVTLFPVPYSTSPLVMEEVRRLGVTVESHARFGQGDPSDIDLQMETDALMALSRGVRQAKDSGRKLLIVDDGGISMRLLAGKAKYVSKIEGLKKIYDETRAAAKDMPIRIVEQTSRGITEFRQAKDLLPPNITVVNMAHSWAKAHADRYIGPVVVQSLEKAVWDLGKGSLKNKRVCLVGYGVIGALTAECLRQYGAHVTVMDINEKNLEKAKGDGFSVESELRSALKEKDIVLGCTGFESVKYEDFEECSRGTIFASATSKSVEFFTQHLDRWLSRVWPQKPGQHGQGVVISNGDPSQHHTSYQVVQWDADDALNQAVYYLLNNGCPINFDGEVNCVDPEHIQVTEAIKFEAIAQAVRTEPGQGLLEMEDRRQERALAAQDKHAPGERA